ncbi:hypothetical protein EDD18DRAFT_1309019 [Armillaria luteobubalina]|uniref:Endonuclease/exonuclease/phosphatase domain-containing protein n=1 Tax=Armillaria luteobubalina TaxID=153913 RepID=A0AA39UPL3_9AGAR|nr:hypothetical protein EDD18DRAFT_1309019 [Armillaria luteobubalina]
MKEKRVSILTLQETHLTEMYVDDIHRLYGERLSVHFSACSSNSSGKAAPWHAGTLLTWLAIYAPNNETEGREMWEQLTQLWLDLKLLTLDGMSRDFNLVEDAIDRLPTHEDNRALNNAFCDFKTKRRLKDGWRHANPERRDYTYTQAAGTFSRSHIDRIYVLDAVLKNSDHWQIRTPPIGTDHQVVSVRIIHAQAPYVGKGRWTMPFHLLSNNKAIKEVENIVKTMAKTMREAKDQRTEEWNPQTVFAKGKRDIVQVLVRYARRSLPRSTIDCCPDPTTDTGHPERSEHE